MCVNELLSLVSSSLLMFADDIKLYYCIHSSEDYAKLQDDTDILLRWLKECNFYPLTCQSIRSCILALPPKLEITLWVTLTWSS